jgi:hypothetical protein
MGWILGCNEWGLRQCRNCGGIRGGAGQEQRRDPAD